VMPPK